MSKKVRIQQKTDRGFEVIHPETIGDLVLINEGSEKLSDRVVVYDNAVREIGDHISNNGVHVASSEREYWNKKIDSSLKGVANGLALLNSQGKVVDSSGNAIENKVKSVNGMTGDVTIGSDASKMNVSGGAFTGIVKAKSNTSYTASQVRNIVLSTAEPSGGENGDIWFVYEP